MTIRYRDGYKYQLAQDYEVLTDITGYSIETQFINLYLSGLLKIKSGYAWDGASGPAIDTKDFMRGSLVHDALYELMRKGLLSTTERDNADKILKKICLEDGMPEFRANYVYDAVHLFAGNSATMEEQRKIYTAPGDNYHGK